MILIEKIKEIRKAVTSEKMQGKKIALVPTMGALHLGHLALIKKAKEVADIVVVSIFVNKTQFNDINDYLKYPKQIADDVAKLQNEKVDYVFVPSEEEIYPKNASFTISSNSLFNCLCGAYRKGHFEGVCLVVSKLFNIVNPDLAIFGEKDFQQVAIIKKLVEDFNFNVEIISHSTIRNENGLALSSRNQRLDDKSLIIATNIFRILSEIKNDVKKDGNIADILQNKKQELLNLGFEKIDYLEIRDEENLNLIEKFNDKIAVRIFIAAYLNNVRLIDNLKL